MKISRNWLNEFVDLGKTSSQEIAKLLTLHTAEVEGLYETGSDFENIVVGKILTMEKHPNADKLTICKVTDGKKEYQVVCGAQNIYIGMQAPFAKIGAKVKWHGEGDPVTLEKAKIRGVESEGMLCAGSEIGLHEEEKSNQQKSGIVDLNDMVDLNAMEIKPGTHLKTIFGEKDTIFEMDNKSLTHRPDLWGHYGIARELAAIFGKKLRPLKLELSSEYKFKTETKFENESEFAHESNEKHNFENEKKHFSKISMRVSIQNIHQCPRYCGIALTNVTIEKSPIWLKTRLESIGYKSINAIVDATNYVMAEVGQPLHAFDLGMIEKDAHGTRAIIIRNAQKKEKFQTLDGNTHSLTKEMLLISDSKKALALAGIMGGQNSEIKDGTTEIFLESANFEPYSTRKTAQSLNLRTESAQRFEKSLDPALAEIALKRLIKLIQTLCPSAQIASSFIDEGTWKPKKHSITVSAEKVNSKLGKKLSIAAMKKILVSLEFTVTSKEKLLEISVPSHRVTKDVLIEDDVIEEIARMYGYEHIEPALPLLPVKVPRDNIERRLKIKARKILSLGLGFTETYNYSFYGEEDYKKCFLKSEDHIVLRNYLSEEQKYMRASLLPNLLKNIRENLRFFNNFKLYEIGRTYKEKGSYMPEEKKVILGAIIVPKKEPGEIFEKALGALETFLAQYTQCEKEIKPAPDYAHPLKFLEFNQGKEKIASCYELHPQIIKNLDLDVKIALFEIDLTNLVKKSQQHEIRYHPLPKFPETSFDVSLIIPEKTTVKNMEDAMKKVPGKLITKITLFDIFKGTQIGEGKKALAFSITLRAEDHTLTDEEIRDMQQKIFFELKKAGAEIRGL
ncbi:phenylalanine--tRNA ligase subunit beta [Candidatus Peregrinibacteria bacterium]|nr:phenylalanine--tRNA ligase subunit beta [Candidatus Peregrinibacteria bacterium]